jgi:hypothetical protein
MNKKIWIKTSVFLLLAIFMLNTQSTVSKAQSDQYIGALNGRISDTYIVRNSRVTIQATLVNFGDLEIEVISFNAEFVHMGGNDRFNQTYTVNYDFDHRTLGPGASLTGTLREEITNPEADYNLTIYFVAADTYHPVEVPGEGSVGLTTDYVAAQNITVSVVDFGGPSNIIIGVGLAFAAIVGIVVIVIIYGWLKEKLAKRKY